MWRIFYCMAAMAAAGNMAAAYQHGSVTLVLLAWLLGVVSLYAAVTGGE